ncbi:hypothetical protein HNQ63_001633 [Wenzhouxiangella marina]|uniref:Uncharacterized protein n=2 Tax=Wenzhouxiangella marina TaxID=1579979 RepID=A0A0K0XZP4_9GAMM|nr:hypothetical protein [Wenzhouxiangella marina]AKS43154.1 hypothetical protein WM2015_2797 [Wenzhouxiangella marina]MBB6087161.1 hypothetical protein [Wenzhouxiangella marina]
MVWSRGARVGQRVLVAMLSMLIGVPVAFSPQAAAQDPLNELQGMTGMTPAQMQALSERCARRHGRDYDAASRCVMDAMAAARDRHAAASSPPPRAAQRSAPSRERAPAASAIAPRLGHCVTVARDEAWGGTSFMDNHCAHEVSVRWCFGNTTTGCETGTSAGSIPANDRSTIYYDRPEYDDLAFIFYACDSRHPGCFDTLNEYARNLDRVSRR